MFRFSRVMAVVLGVAMLTLSTGSLRADLVGYWNFDNNVNDSSGHTNNGVIQGTIGSGFGYAQGKFGGSNGGFAFIGNDSDYVSVANSTSLSAAWSGFTVSLWINQASSNTTASALGKYQGTNEGFLLQKYAGSRSWFIGTGGSGGASAYTQVNPGAYDNGQWNSVVLRYDGSNFTTYLNGSLVDTEAGTFVNRAVAMTFGRDNRIPEYSMTGSIDDAAIFSNALTVGETESIYNVGNSSLDYSMADMNTLFLLYQNGGTTTTSDGKTWYASSSLSGTPGSLVPTDGNYSVVFGDAGIGGVTTVPEPGAIVLLAIGLFGLLAYAWRKRQ